MSVVGELNLHVKALIADHEITADLVREGRRGDDFALLEVLKNGKHHGLTARSASAMILLIMSEPGRRGVV